MQNIKRSVLTNLNVRELSCVLYGQKVIFTETFEVTDPTTWAQGTGAFLAPGAISGTVAADVATPLDGLQSLSYTQGLGSLADWIANPANVATTAFMKGNLCPFSFNWTYDGADGDINVEFWDATNGVLLLDFPLPAAAVKTTFSQKIAIPANCDNVRFGFSTKVENLNKVLLVDNYSLVTDPVVGGLDKFQVDSYVRNAVGDYTLSVKNRLNNGSAPWQVIGHGVLTATTTVNLFASTHTTINFKIFAMNGTTAKDGDFHVTIVGTDTRILF
jgi:hypothetical protein